MIIIYLLTAAAVAIADQLSKVWIVNNISLGSELSVLPGIFHLTYVKNTGAAFSMLSGHVNLLLIITIAASILILFVLFKADFNWVGKLSLSVILGGAIGNIIDRVYLGYIVDMIEVEFVNFAIFNVADSFICVGGVVFCIYYLFFHDKRTKGVNRKYKKAARMPELDRLNKNVPEAACQPETNTMEPSNFSSAENAEKDAKDENNA